jgi:TRAP-type C4-dicarboxylate transport system permease small subunit
VFALSLVLPARADRWLNIIFGGVYSLIMILAIRGGWHFYILFGSIEITLTALIVWYAWTRPTQASN